ncbi:uncharacterized protein J4E88_003984 [Alternaria novae-zelandiae]|uniref:uncharacterized protein n=1 Tax=Alternaria novae-zelandiae TaxID=430562 RepID=UPI0020C39AF3|nr:uncharacterized protein J4E88_003984 [Alternaria novae-zelandiae]KAI4686147.1 hypothetical protein J4E88_003984 [Alternaria novae-zelandiae]
MDHHYLFYPDYDPNPHSNELKTINRQWTRYDGDRLRCTTDPAYFLGIRDGGDAFDALVLSESLAEKIQNALCIAHSYWTTPEKYAEEVKVRFENEARTEAWEEELEHLIEVTKKRNSIACGRTLARSGDIDLSNYLGGVLRGRDAESRALTQDPETEDIGAHAAEMGGRIDHEVPIVPNVLVLSFDPGLILDHEDKTTGPGIVEESLIPMKMEGRNTPMGEVVDNLVIDLSPAHGRKGMTVDNTMTELPSIHTMVLRVRVRRFHLIHMLKVTLNCGAWRNPIAIHATSPQPV